MIIPCYRGGHHCRWPACPLDCDGRKIVSVLEHYADQYCEGWCKDAPANVSWDCGGCKARIALDEVRKINAT